MHNIIANCPLLVRCSGHCRAKIVQMPTQTILYAVASHTAADHIALTDKGKFLLHQQKHLIATAVKLGPMQKPLAS